MIHTGKFNKIPLRKRSSKDKNITSTPKLPKHQLPENFQPKNDPLYSLPKELLNLSFAANSKKSGSIIKRRNTRRHEKCKR